MRDVRCIILHCSATRWNQDIGVKEIDQWHKARGFAKIGYNKVIRLSGKIEDGRDYNEVGAHCQGFNKYSIGICYVGGIDSEGKCVDTRNEKQKYSLHYLVDCIRSSYGNIPVIAHNWFNANKACPCIRQSELNKEFNTKVDWSKVDKEVKSAEFKEHRI